MPILITGESGVGKESIAMAIHYNGIEERAARDFVAVNTAAIPPALIESELFGAVRGAYTGSNADKKGKICAADKGTFFLDEIGDMDHSLQAKLLRLLQEGEVQRVGENKPSHVDVRFISATNREVESMIKEGKFREDLFYRLSTWTIEVPTLRERREDIPLIAGHVLRDYIQKGFGYNIQGFTTGAVRKLTDPGYNWPGNVRELESVVQRAMILRQNGAIDAGDIAFGREEFLRRKRKVFGNVRE
jgi:two-component system response regulator HydG